MGPIKERFFRVFPSVYSIASFCVPTLLFLNLPWLLDLISSVVFTLIVVLIAISPRFRQKPPLNGVLTFLAFFSIFSWRYLSNPGSFRGTAFVPLVYYLSLGITACWVLCFSSLRPLLEKWFFPWTGFLFLSMVVLRWHPYKSPNETRFSLYSYTISLLVIIAFGLLWIKHESERNPSS